MVEYLEEVGSFWSGVPLSNNHVHGVLLRVLVNLSAFRVVGVR